MIFFRRALRLTTDQVKCIIIIILFIVLHQYYLGSRLEIKPRTSQIYLRLAVHAFNYQVFTLLYIKHV
uniref:Uncharacterized protein n=1 Tax=Panstrongylus lignarius TaxID=156445 RepID=A0A224XUW7_9HEMI